MYWKYIVRDGIVAAEMHRDRAEEFGIVGSVALQAARIIRGKIGRI